MTVEPNDFLHFVLCICSITVYLQSFLFCAILHSVLHTLDLSCLALLAPWCVLSWTISLQVPSSHVLRLLQLSFCSVVQHALDLVLEVCFYFCFPEVNIFTSKKQIFVASAIWLDLAPSSFSLCPPSPYLSIHSHGKCMINVLSEKVLICLPFCFA